MTATKFMNALQGSYDSIADLRLATRTTAVTRGRRPKIISGSDPACTFQSTGRERPATRTSSRSRRSPPTAPCTCSSSTARTRRSGRWTFDFDYQLMVDEVHRRRRDLDAPVRRSQLEDGAVRHAVDRDRPAVRVGSPDPVGLAGNISVNPTTRRTSSSCGRTGGRRTRTRPTTASTRSPGRHPTTTRVARARDRTPTSTWSRSTDGGATWSAGRSSMTAVVPAVVPMGRPPVRRFASRSRGTRTRLRLRPIPSSTCSGSRVGQGGSRCRRERRRVGHALGRAVHDGVAGDLRSGRIQRRASRREGKDCNVFHGDYTGLAVGPGRGDPRRVDRSQPLATSPQVDFYIGGKHDGYAQDAMYARR